MSLIDALRHRLTVLVKRDAYNRELDDEMRFHLALDAEQEQANGLSSRDAGDSARRHFGNITYHREETRRQTSLGAMNDVAQDIRYAARTFRRAPGFTIAATLTLALGIGATTAIFSIVEGVLVRGLPYRDADRIVDVWEASDNHGYRLPSYPTFKDWQQESRSWSDAFEEMAFIKGAEAIYVGDKGPERLLSSFVSPGFFHVLGVSPYLGRTFLPEEEQRGGNSVAVMSYEEWQHRFGGDPAIVGKSVRYSGAPTTIVGVMPRGFAYPAWSSTQTSALWQPIALIEDTNPSLSKRGVHTDSRTIARLRSAADSARVATVMRTVEQRLAQAYPDEQAHWTSAVMLPIREEVLGGVQSTLLMLAGAVVLVLLLACANVANLLLVRASVRDRELGVRAALGAGRPRLIRQLLVESSTLAVAGGALGVALAAAIVRTVRVTARAELPRANEIVVEPRAIFFAVAVSLLAALLAGIAPALRATHATTLARLRSGVHGSVGTHRDTRLRAVLVAVQFALALVLLIGSGLLIRSFVKLQSVDLGFDPHDRVAIGVSPPAGKYGDPAAASVLYRRLLESMAAVPGVRDVGLVNHLPIGGGWVMSPLQVDGRTDDVTRQPQVFYRTASQSYLRTMGMRITRGHWFTDADIRDKASFVVNETLARQMWSSADPIGQRITLRRSSQLRPDYGQPVSGVIIGVISDVRQNAIGDPPSPEAFVPWTLEVWPWITLVAHVQNPAREIPLLRRAILDVDPTIPVGSNYLQGGFVTIESTLSSSEVQRRLATSLVGAFAAAALLLAAIGMYGVVAYGVAQRTREIGVRMALGASDRRILRLILGEGFRLAVFGAVLGVAASFVSTRLIRSLLFETVPTDPLTFIVTPLILAGVALLATYLPARRATRLDPTLAIRGE
ncbi:MAG TPA: ABC transporter permease [Gemmatimonadaceae bacterium]|nr:ABC transporter permease [Gemmatimonadaceae bacterium]